MGKIRWPVNVTEALVLANDLMTLNWPAPGRIRMASGQGYIDALPPPLGEESNLFWKQQNELV